MSDFTDKEDLREYQKRQKQCRRCKTLNWWSNLDEDDLCPFCVDIERVILHFKNLEKAEDDLKIIAGQPLTKRQEKKLKKRKEMYISSLDELKGMVDSMSPEEKKQTLRDLGFDNYDDVS